MKQIITIGRQYGSGGHEIGKKLAEKLGYAFYDKDILANAARKMNVCQAVLAESDESQTSSLLYSIVMRNSRSASFEEKLAQQERHYLRQQAQKGPCVIIGRCANHIFRDDPGLMSIFVSSPLEARVKRIMERYHVSDEEARRRIHTTDKKRANYYNYHTDAKWSDINQYHLVIDRTLFGVDKTVDLLAQLIAARE